jgi:hypothetical protein
LVLSGSLGARKIQLIAKEILLFAAHNVQVIWQWEIGILMIINVWRE